MDDALYGPDGLLHACRRWQRRTAGRLLDVTRGRPAVRRGPRPVPRSRMGAARSARCVHRRRRRRRAGHARPVGVGRRAGVRAGDAVRRGRDLRRTTRPSPRRCRVAAGDARWPLRGRDRRQRTARQPAVSPGRVRRRVGAKRSSRSIASGRAVERLSAPFDPVPHVLPPHAEHGARAPLVDRAAAVGRRRPRVGSHAARWSSSTTASPAPANWPPGRGGSGSGPFAGNERGEHYLQRSRLAGHHRRRPVRPVAGAGLGPDPSAVPPRCSESTNSSRTAGDSGSSTRLDPASRRCACGVGSVSPRRSSTRRASVASSSPSGAPDHAARRPVRT